MSMMRLFLAVCFDNAAKSVLAGKIQELKDNSLSGKFVETENLHLTLVFIGQTSGYSLLTNLMDAVEAQPFELDIEGCGRFPRRDGSIYWIGVRENPNLNALYRELFVSLRQNGFLLEDKPYKPHITLARQVKLKPEFDPELFSDTAPKIHLPVQDIFLMKSERIKGKLVYTPVYQKKLGGSYTKH